MEDSFCEELLKNESTGSNIEDLYWSYVTNCVLNAFLSYTAIMLNILTIHAMRKTPSLPKPLKTLLVSLAVSDLGVGLLVQPLYIATLGNWSQHNNTNCSTDKALKIAISVFFFPSFFGVMALSVDRFLAIHLHLRYQELVTHKRAVAMVILIWFVSPFLSLILFTTWIPKNISRVLMACGAFFCLLSTTLFNYKIFFAIRRHTNQIQAFQLQEQTAQNGEMANFASIKKSALGTFYVYLLFLFCYMPHGFNIMFILIYGTTTVNASLSLYFQTLVFTNSSLNPVIYCWKMRHIRHAIIDILRKYISKRN